MSPPHRAHGTLTVELASFRNPASAAPDGELIQIVAAAWSEAARLSGDWLVCRSGCSQCCHGPFPINALDADRLARGMAALDIADPVRALHVRQRARAAVAKLSPDFPGDPATGILFETPEAQARFETFADDEPCPALDPLTGACDLYAWRPLTCRVFGPPLSSEDQAVAVCELCYQGATDSQIAACAVPLDVDSIERPLVAALEAEHGRAGNTLVAFSLASA